MVHMAAHEGEGSYADVVFMDPPRKGCDSAALEFIIGSTDAT